MSNNFYMLTLMWIIIMMLMLILPFSNLHPMILVIFTLTMNIMICSIMSMWKSSFLYSMIFILIMISGLLIIFLYFSSFISNESMQTKMNIFVCMILVLNIKYMMLLSNMFHLYSPIFLNEPTMSNNINILFQENSTLFMYYPATLPLSLISMLFLLLSLLSVIKICSPQIKPLRKAI